MTELEASRRSRKDRKTSPRVRNPEVHNRLACLPADADRRRSPFAVRRAIQHQALKLPPFPTTTIGSFPQTGAIRSIRAAFKKGGLSEAEYRDRMKAEIRLVVERQEALGLDVLVHGEPERNDMVEYFGEQLAGFAFTRNGWVQSYGKPLRQASRALRRRVAPRPDDRRMDTVRPRVDGQADERHRDGPDHDPAMVFRAR